MAWTIPTARTTGELITASIWNTDLKDNLLLLKTSIADDGRVNGEIRAYRENVVSAGIVAGVVTIDVSAAAVYTVSVTAPITTLSVIGWTASKAATVTIRLTQDATGGRAVTLPSAWRWAGGIAPPITTTANKTDILVLYSDDGGATIYPSLFTANA